MKILIGMTLGLILGIVSLSNPTLSGLVIDFIKPIGSIFIRGLKMIAMPLVLASLIIGVANIGDISKLSRMGGKTVGIFVLTTVISITLGLALVGIMKPGERLSAETRTELMSEFDDNAGKQISVAEKLKPKGPLEPLVNMVPDNILLAATNNRAMLQIVFFALIVGVALLQVPKEKGKPVLDFFNGFNEVVIKIVQYIMMIAPYGVFALMASLIIEIAGDNPSRAWELLLALLWYAVTVIIGMLVMMMLVYPLLIKFFSNIKYLDFFKGIRPAML
ncbi:MAG: cation:dicarboxylase symporter family transporter, partial [Bacteroidota bacterium]